MPEQLFQIAIKALIRNSDGKVLLLCIPQFDGDDEHWDLPGGRMNPGETFAQTLRRELREEIGVDYGGEPKHVATVLSNITIPVGDKRVPLALVAYEVDLPAGTTITLGADEPETEFDWYAPADAAKRLAWKYTPDFCSAVAAL